MQVAHDAWHPWHCGTLLLSPYVPSGHECKHECECRKKWSVSLRSHEVQLSVVSEHVLQFGLQASQSEVSVGKNWPALQTLTQIPPCSESSEEHEVHSDAASQVAHVDAQA